MNRKYYLNMMNFLSLALFIVLLLFQAALLRAEKISPEKVRISTPVYAPELSHFNPPLGQYAYTVSWNGIPAGMVELDLNRNGDDYEIKAIARTAEVIDYVYKLRFFTEATLSAETLLPRRSFFISQENSREKRIELEFLPNGEIHSERINHRGKLESIHFYPDNFTLDPYSTAFLALSMYWEVGDKRQFDTFNGKDRYLIELTAVSRTGIIVNGRNCEAIVISPSVKKLTDTDPKKLRKARIYISADDPREILKISSDLLIGSVDMDIVFFTPATARAPEPALVEKPDIYPATKSVITNTVKQKAGIHENNKKIMFTSSQKTPSKEY
jgi:hypothetical protein